jgi:hypothetical protein
VHGADLAAINFPVFVAFSAAENHVVDLRDQFNCPVELRMMTGKNVIATVTGKQPALIADTAALLLTLVVIRILQADEGQIIPPRSRCSASDFRWP